MKKIILFCLMILPAYIITQSQWIEKKYDIGRFYLNFPSVPTYTYGSFHGWSSKDKNGQVTYLMSFMEAPSNVEMSLNSVENYLLPSMLAGDIQISTKNSTYNGFKTLEFHYKTNHEPVLFKRGRAIVVNQKLYLLQVHYYHESLADFDRFAKSLRFF